MGRADALHVVLGAGAIGLAVVDVLAAHGEPVRVVSRRGEAPVPEGVEVRAADLTDPAAAAEACAGARVVYHCAAPPYSRWTTVFPALQRGIVAGAAAAGARLVVTENLYGYGPTGGVPLTEDTPMRPATSKGRVRAALAQELMEAHRAGRVAVTAARPADYLGPRGRASAFGAHVFEPVVRSGTARVLGDPDTLHSISFLPDIADALVTLGAREEALGLAWHVPCAPAVTQRELVTRAFAIAGTRGKVAGTPGWLLRLAGITDAGARGSVEMLASFREDLVVDSSRYTRTFGGSATPLDEALERTVAWFRDR